MHTLQLFTLFHMQAYYHGGGFGHMIISSIVHGLIYGVIFKIMHSLGIVGSIILAVVVIGGIYGMMAYRKKGF